MSDQARNNQDAEVEAQSAKIDSPSEVEAHGFEHPQEVSDQARNNQDEEVEAQSDKIDSPSDVEAHGYRHAG